MHHVVVVDIFIFYMTNKGLYFKMISFKLLHTISWRDRAWILIIYPGMSWNKGTEQAETQTEAVQASAGLVSPTGHKLLPPGHWRC